MQAVEGGPSQAVLSNNHLSNSLRLNLEGVRSLVSLQILDEDLGHSFFSVRPLQFTALYPHWTLEVKARWGSMY